MNVTNVTNATNATESFFHWSDLSAGAFSTLMKGLGRLIAAQADSIPPVQLPLYDSSLFNVFTYGCLMYGVACLVVSFIINRTMVLAAPSVHTQPSIKHARTVTITILRLSVLSVIFYSLFNVLVGLRLLNYTTSNPQLLILLVQVIPELFAYNPDGLTSNSYMLADERLATVGPLLAMYWPVFLTFCLLTFVETLCLTLYGERPLIKSTISLFELSAALHELSKTGFFFHRTTKMPLEQALVMCFFQLLCHLNIHLGALINNNKYRLIPLTIFNLGFLTYIFSCFCNDDKADDFPFVLMAVVLPQLFVTTIIICSIVIFLVALIASGFSLRDLNFGSFFLASDDTGHRFNVTLQDDFITALYGIGLISVTLAGKSSYITELSLVNANSTTWLEQSLWQSLVAQVKGLRASGVVHVNSNNLIQYLRQHKISGYANIIETPSKRMITGGKHSFEDDGGVGLILRSNNISLVKQRILLLTAIATDFYQLTKGLVYKIFVSFRQKFRHFQEEVVDASVPETETDEQFERRRLSVPKFLRKYVVQAKKDLTVYVDVNDLDEDTLLQKYPLLIQGLALSEIDDSADYVVAAEYESDSDVESIDLSEGVTMLELVTHETVEELLDVSSLIQLHMRYNAQLHRVMTRSKYQALAGPRDESDKLMELILAKRSGQLKDIFDNKQTAPQSDDLNVSPFDCVICQTNSREIITWPCRCFAICESCRLSLVSKGMQGCVCCRRDVEGVSKIFIP